MCDKIKWVTKEKVTTDNGQQKIIGDKRKKGCLIVTSAMTKQNRGQKNG